MNEAMKTPWHVWAVGIVALLWNAGGANDYIQVQSENLDYIGMAAESYGVSAAQVVAYYDAWPVWVHACWAIAIWGSVLGCLLILLRSRFALHCFIASLVTMTITFVYRTLNPLEGVETGFGTLAMTVLIFAAGILLAFYSHRMAKAGVLK
ncbi:MAG: hypothetical protein ACX930_05655 [Erythrobacter sp.]